jgi:hypothetical protein
LLVACTHFVAAGLGRVRPLREKLNSGESSDDSLVAARIDRLTLYQSGRQESEDANDDGC